MKVEIQVDGPCMQHTAPIVPNTLILHFKPQDVCKILSSGLCDEVLQCSSVAAPTESIPCSNDFGTLTLRRGIRNWLILQSHYP